MAISASKITPINDGKIATTSPQDHAILAKTGGPFYTLFNGIYAKINEISSVLPKSMPYEFPEQSIKELYRPLYNQQNQSENASKSLIFMEELTKNPMLIRSLSQLISESINKSINGDKSTYSVGIPTPRFKNNSF